MALRTSAILAFLLLAAASWAGCLGGDGKAETTDLVVRKSAARSAVKTYDNAVEARINQSAVRIGDYTVSDWHLVASRATPEGVVTAFSWTVPSGANIGLRYAPSRGLVLELAPVVTGSSAPNAWCLAAFMVQDSKAVLLGTATASPIIVVGELNIPILHCAAERQVVTRTAGAKTGGVQPASVEPSFFVIDDTRIRDGMTIYFVLGVRASNETEFGLALRPLNHFPAGAERPSANLDEFLLSTGSLRPIAARVTGSGVGLHVGYYTEVQGPTLNGSNVNQIDVETWTSDLKITERLPNEARPAATVRDTTFRSEMETAQGWSFMSGEYFGICATGRWDAKGDLHGNALAARSLILYHIICGAIYAWIPEYLVFGVPSFTFYAEGPGKATATLELLVTNAAIESVSFAHVGFGATLTELIKIPSQKYLYAETGLAGNVPPGAEAKVRVLPIGPGETP